MKRTRSRTSGVVGIAPNGLAPMDGNDLSVMTLAAPIPSPGYAQLPGVGYDDTLPNNQPVEIVGYGIQSQAPLVLGTRFGAPAKIVPGGGATGGDFLKISSSPGQGGATSQGDSGRRPLDQLLRAERHVQGRRLLRSGSTRRTRWPTWSGTSTTSRFPQVRA